MKPINTVVSISLASAKQTAATPAAKAATPAAGGTKEFSSLLESLVSHAHSEGDQEKALPKELLEKVEVMLSALQEQPVKELTAAEGAKTFSSLLESLSNAAQQGENPETALPEELLEKVEDMLVLLQKQPVEELTDAQQKIIYELMQMISSQMEKKESLLLADTGGRGTVRPVLPESEKQGVSKEVQVKLLELVKKLSDLMPAALTTDTKKYGSASAIMGVEGKIITLDAEKIETITNKITEFTDTLATIEKKAATGGRNEMAAKLLEAISAEEQLKLLGEVKNADADEPEALKAQFSAPVAAAGRSDGGHQQETAQQDDNSTANTKKTDLDSSIMKAEGKTIAGDAEKIEALTNKITESTKTLADIEEKAATVGHTEAAVKIRAISAEEQLKPSEEAKSVNVDEPEALKAQTSAPVAAAARSDEGQQQETAQQDDAKQGLIQTTATAESAKPASVPAQVTQQMQAKPELPLSQAPMVRMNNLTEELGEVFKNSLRMSTSGESTQIKVNISPDHLGHLDIRLTETNGRIAAQIFTSSLAAKEALDLQLNQLRSTLVQQGMTVEKIEVVQNNSQQSLGQQNAQSEQRFSQQQRQNPAGRERNGYQQIDDKTAVQRSYLDSGTMKVDYTV